MDNVESVEKKKCIIKKADYLTKTIIRKIHIKCGITDLLDSTKTVRAVTAVAFAGCCQLGKGIVGIDPASFQQVSIIPRRQFIFYIAGF